MPVRSPSISPARDRWAHRRAEPRPFAFLWIIFLISSSAATIGAMGMLGLQPPDVYRPAVRLFLALAGAGVVVFWPMIRLCQSPPRSPFAACLQDAMVVLIPMQAAIWPQAWRWMAGWPLGVVGAIALVMGSWVLIVAAGLAWAQRDIAALERTIEFSSPRVTSAPRRAGWMGGFLLAGAIGPLVSFILATRLPPGHDAIALPLLASPVTAVLEIARDRSWSGHPTADMPAHWIAGVITLGLGVFAMLIIGPRSRRLAGARID